MAVITGITQQKKDKTRCNLEVDGRFYCGMGSETVLSHRLKVGSVVTEAELSALQLESEKQTALDKALSHISASMKTEREVRDFLARKGYLADVIDHTIEKMKSYGYLDDAQYARQYAESVGKRKGERAIRAELLRKGVAEAEVSAALKGLTEQGETAKRVLEKYLRGKELTRETLRKAYAYLLSKGFGYDTAREALGGLADED